MMPFSYAGNRRAQSFRLDWAGLILLASGELAQPPFRGGLRQPPDRQF